MIAARYRWRWQKPDEALAREWSERLQIPYLAACVLASRGYTESEAADMLHPADKSRLMDPFMLKGMGEAVNRIRQAIEKGEHIRVYGDYDADGVTSTALMSKLFTKLGARFDTYIPHRRLEGYGLNKEAIEQAAAAGVNLIVTVDNGISAVDQIAYASELNIDVVVTDHHEVPAQLPEAAALVNPKQPDCPYPNKGLCGAGVAFKLAHALLGEPPLEWAELAAIGTIADLMPLLGENRLIVQLGLARMRRDPSVGIRALAALCQTAPSDLTSGRVGFALAPRLNAGGRLDRADGAVQLLTTADEAEAERLALGLNQLNLERQQLVETTLEEAEQQWQVQQSAWQTARGEDGPNVIVLSSESWHAGVAGLVASKLAERHYRPAFVLAADAETGLAKGSARSIDGFDLFAALTACAEDLEQFGGHQAAAGLTIRTDRIDRLIEKLHQLTLEQLLPEDWVPQKQADLVCGLDQVTLEAAEALGKLEPFGNGNRAPRLVIADATVQESRLLGKDGKHIRLLIAQQDRLLEAVGFGMGALADQLYRGRKLDLLGEIAVNEWNGKRRVQFVVQDMRSDEWHWIDRRSLNAQQARQEIAALASELGPDLLVMCGANGAQTGWDEITGIHNSAVLTWTEAVHLTPASTRESAAARERTDVDTQPPLYKTLALYGLPDQPSEIRALGQRLAEHRYWTRIYLFNDHASRRTPAEHAERPSREQYGRVYKLFRQQGEWIGGPNGFAREAAKRIGLSPAVVLAAEEVFAELGFIRSDGNKCSVVADPPKRKLEESQLYMRQVRQAMSASFPDWPLDRLKSWAERTRHADVERMHEINTGHQ